MFKNLTTAKCPSGLAPQRSRVPVLHAAVHRQKAGENTQAHSAWSRGLPARATEMKLPQPKCPSGLRAPAALWRVIQAAAGLKSDILPFCPSTFYFSKNLILSVL